ncbi:MAG TPA: methyltransferase domain-containing protein [Bacteroidales bacterium]|nr:methyltransferase domain-containing protein [Bacteroidales bacterium]HNQ83468.1 methyltransferase domain-containing protein [Bacteroidales bacterium]HOX77817.1 methyltransferase domain-containing protein [Bacteroidales bacterium]HPI87153.1 methyltransferase domain-containing protein [Bacteroidales bacterium]HPM91473.1 methyltransferase domain-containing protein [Bacteroidales bacterium]
MIRKNTWTDKEVEAHWDNVADIYVAENNKVKDTHDQRFRETVHHLRLEPGMKVLNITSRDAEADDYIRRANRDVEVINAEISSGLIDVAAKIRPAVKQVKIGNYSILPFQDAEFDRVISLETLEHVAEPLRFLSELHRVSNPDARLVLSCPPATSELPYRIYTALFGGHGEGPHRFLPSKEVKEMFAETKWKPVLHKGTILIPVGPSWLRNFGENIIGRFQGTFIAELGIRQFFVCEKA